MVYGAPSRKYPIHLQFNTKAYRCVFNLSRSQTQRHKHNHAHNCMHMQVTLPPIPHPNTHACTHTTNACIVLTAVTVKRWNEQKSKQNFRAEVICPQLCLIFHLPGVHHVIMHEYQFFMWIKFKCYKMSISWADTVFEVFLGRKLQQQYKFFARKRVNFFLPWSLWEGSPWYNHNGWLGIKQHVTYLLVGRCCALVKN